MASLAELISEKDKNTLVQIIIDENNKRERELFERRKKEAFNNIDEVIEYMKSHRLGYTYTMFEWNESNKEKPIIWTHQTSYDDCVFWDVRESMTIEEFKERFDKGMDEYGFLYGFSKYLY